MREGGGPPPGIGSYQTCPSPTHLTTEYESEDHLEVPCTAEREWNGDQLVWNIDQLASNGNQLQ